MRQYEAGDKVRLLSIHSDDDHKKIGKVERVYPFPDGLPYLSLRYPDGSTAYVRSDQVKRAESERPMLCKGLQGVLCSEDANV